MILCCNSSQSTLYFLTLSARFCYLCIRSFRYIACGCFTHVSLNISYLPGSFHLSRLCEVLLLPLFSARCELCDAALRSTVMKASLLSFSSLNTRSVSAFDSVR